MKNFDPVTGTTHCPHCDTRFKISAAQLGTPHGMVRCGHCLRVFNAHSKFVSKNPDWQPDQQLDQEPDRQLKLPIADMPGEPDKSDEPDLSDIPVLRPMTLAEQVVIVPDDDDGEAQPKRRTWPWALASLLLLLALFGQAVYFLRTDLAARLPSLKPALVGYCRLLKCSVPLPQKAELLSIESSGLEADPARENQIILNALLRNRATFTQAFPSLELTLNDAQDKPVARRVFRPADYLPLAENEKSGLLPNREIIIRLHLNTANLNPVGYRLMLVDSNNSR